MIVPLSGGPYGIWIILSATYCSWGRRRIATARINLELTEEVFNYW